jgi:hypothetical protein
VGGRQRARRGDRGGADAQIDKLAKKYIGKDEYPWRNPAETRLKVLIEPEKVDASGFDS